MCVSPTFAEHLQLKIIALCCSKVHSFTLLMLFPFVHHWFMFVRWTPCRQDTEPAVFLSDIFFPVVCFFWGLLNSRILRSLLMAMFTSLSPNSKPSHRGLRWQISENLKLNSEKLEASSIPERFSWKPNCL